MKGECIYNENIELKSKGASIYVDSSNVSEYVNLYSDWILKESMNK